MEYPKPFLCLFRVLRAPRAVQDTDRDFFMGAEEAVDYGLIDAVISRPQLIAATNGASP